jgi:ATP/ADP translocase
MNALVTLLWPIERKELKKFTLMALLNFAILFNYSLIHAIKDGLIVSNAGAETTNFIEVLVLLPVIAIFMLGYMKLSTVIASKEKIFHIICGFFIAFFFLFAFLIFPNLPHVIPDKELVNTATQSLPSLKWLAIIYVNWPFVLFNIFSELWINVMLALLFWQYANAITPYEQAKRFYPLLAFIGNFGLIAGGLVLNSVCICKNIATIINNLSTIIIITGLVIMIFFKWLASTSNEIEHGSADELDHLSFKESLKIVFSSKIIWLLSIIVICYGLIISISIGIWKAQAAKLYPSMEEYMLFISYYEQWAGAAIIIFTVLGSVILRNFSWFFASIITPIITLLTGLAFFLCLSYSEYCIPIWGYPILYTTVVMGTAHIILVKSAKFSLFNPTKELAFISLKKNLRDKGKAAVELLGERIGKAGGAFFQAMLFTLVPGATYDSLSMLLLFIFLFIILLWLFFTWVLYQQLKSINSKI